jgi:hypothetical protein
MLARRISWVTFADPTVFEKLFREANGEYKNSEWELEDRLGAQLLSAFVEEYPNAIVRECTGKVEKCFGNRGSGRLGSMAVSLGNNMNRHPISCVS